MLRILWGEAREGQVGASDQLCVPGACALCSLHPSSPLLTAPLPPPLCLLCRSPPRMLWTRCAWVPLILTAWTSTPCWTTLPLTPPSSALPRCVRLACCVVWPFCVAGAWMGGWMGGGLRACWKDVGGCPGSACSAAALPLQALHGAPLACCCSRLPPHRSVLGLAQHIKGPDGVEFKVTKGAPQIIAKLCGAEDQPEMKMRVEAEVANLGSRGIRSLAVARTAAGSSMEEGQETWELLGMLTFLDPPRPDTKTTIEQALENGVDVKMITGDQVGGRQGGGPGLYCPGGCVVLRLCQRGWAAARWGCAPWGASLSQHASQRCRLPPRFPPHTHTVSTLHNCRC